MEKRNWLSISIRSYLGEAVKAQKNEMWRGNEPTLMTNFLFPKFKLQKWWKNTDPPQKQTNLMTSLDNKHIAENLIDFEAYYS